MTSDYQLYFGDRTYSSWSVRGWLVFKAFGIPVTTHMVGLLSGTKEQDMAHLQPARLVPVLTSDGIVV